METKTIRELTPAAQAAKLIRGILKENFPTTKFKVTSSNYSMGDSVDVKWFNGVTSEAVKKVINHFQYGHFDGMIDCYENSNTIEGLPQTKYLMCDRAISDNVVREFSNKMKTTHNELKDISNEDLGTSFEFWGEYQNWHQLAWRELREKELVEAGLN